MLLLMDYLELEIPLVEVLIISSGSFTEGRLAAKAAVKYIEDRKADGIKFRQTVWDFKKAVYKPLETILLLE